MVNKHNGSDEPEQVHEDVVGTEEELEEVEEEPVLEPEDKTPVFLREDPPDPAKKGDYIKWALMHGITEEDLKGGEYGELNPRTVDICAYDLEKEGHRKRHKKEKPGKELVPTGGQKGLQTFAKGSPPEALIESISIPVEDGEGPIFEKGMKFGMTVLTLGVRVAQELSNMGIQQARPLVEMARDMRAGEAAAAKNAAGEAAMMAAGMVQQSMQPTLSMLAEQGKTPAGADPVKAMMVRTMEPLIQRMMGSVVPGMGNQEPQGWVRRKE